MAPSARTGCNVPDLVRAGTPTRTLTVYECGDRIPVHDDAVRILLAFGAASEQLLFGRYPYGGRV